MQKLKAAIAGILSLISVTAAVAQSAPATMGYHTVWGRLGATVGDTGPAQAIPFATLFSQGLFGSSTPTPGDIAIVGTPPAAIADSGAAFMQGLSAWSGGGTPATGLGIATGHVIAPLDSNVIYSGNGVFPFQVDSTNPYAIGVAGTIGSSTVGQTFSVRFTSTHLSGSPITVTYTAVVSDTVSTINTNLCNAINANTTLYVPGTALPVFCQSINQASPGLFNLQWNAAYSDMTIASTGTGTITGLSSPTRTLDFMVLNLGRNIPGYVGQNGDNIGCFQIMGQSNSGVMDAVVGTLCGSLPNAQGGTITGLLSLSASVNSASQGGMAISNGVILYDTGGALPTNGFLGPGTLNVPNKVVLAGGCGLQLTAIVACGGNIFGNTSVTGVLNLQSTQNGAPTTDAVQITTNNTVQWTFPHGGGATLTNIAAPSSPASGFGAIFMDSTNLRFHDKNSAGTIGTTVVADTGATNNFITAISASGVISKAQPAFSNLSGTIATGQVSGSYTGITGVGTLTVGTWQATAIAGLYGGTGLAAAAVGDIMYASATTPTWARLAAVATGSVLASAGINTAPAWTTGPQIGSLGIGHAANARPLSAFGGAGVNVLFQFTNNTTNDLLTDGTYFGILTGGQDFIFVNQESAAVSFGTAGRSQDLYIGANGGVSVGTSGTDPGAGALVANASIKATTYLQSGATTVSGLPSCAAGTKGARHFVTDATAAFTAGIGAVVAGSGANNVPVTCDGTSWRIG